MSISTGDGEWEVGVCRRPLAFAEAASALAALSTAGTPDGGWIPARNLPRWRDVPALAWLMTLQLGGGVVRLPVLGPSARALGWIGMVIVLAGSRAERACAAVGRSAVLTVRQLRPGRRRWRRTLLYAVALPVAAAVLALPSSLLLVASAVAATLQARTAAEALQITAGLVFLVLASLMLACVVPGLSAVAPAERRQARRWARMHDAVLVEVTMLASTERSDLAATVLARRLLAHADGHGVAVIARPRTEQLAAQYAVIGFGPLPGGRGRILLRPPAGVPAAAV